MMNSPQADHSMSDVPLGDGSIVRDARRLVVKVGSALVTN